MRTAQYRAAQQSSTAQNSTAQSSTKEHRVAPGRSEDQLPDAMSRVWQLGAGWQLDVLHAVGELRRHVALGLGLVSVEHLRPAEVANGGARQLQVVCHAVVVHRLRVAAHSILEVLRVVVHTLGVLIKLRRTVSLDRLEEVPAAGSNLLAQLVARARVFALILAQHELLTWLLTIFSKMECGSVP